MIDFTVTLSGATPLIAKGLPPAYASLLVIQDKSGANVAFGGSTIATTGGITLVAGSPGGSVTMPLPFPRGACLNNIYLLGTNGNVINIAHEPSV